MKIHLLLFFTAFLLIIVLSLRFIFFFENRTKLDDGEVLKFKTSLLSEPKISSKTQKFNINYNSNRIFITTTLFPRYHYGDTLEISGPVRIKPNGTSNRRSQLITMNFPQIEANSANKNPLLAITSTIRQKIIKFFERNLAPDQAGLLLGIVFGIKEEIPADFIKVLQNVGVMHIIAASGMNVTMTAGFLSSILMLFLRRQTALVISIIGILFYAVLAGLEASIIRASIMGTLVFLAQILGRQAWPGFILVLTGYTMLLWDPSLIFDIGFQLSFLATAGLLFLPAGKFNSQNAIFESFQTTIVAQIATLPVIIANFGFYSIYSILVNGLVLWTVPLLMVIGAVASILAFIIEPVARLIVLLSLPILIYFEAVVKFFSGLGNVVKIEELNWFMISGYYLLVLSLTLLIQRNEDDVHLRGNSTPSG